MEHWVLLLVMNLLMHLMIKVMASWGLMIKIMMDVVIVPLPYTYMVDISVPCTATTSVVYLQEGPVVREHEFILQWLMVILLSIISFWSQNHHIIT